MSSNYMGQGRLKVRLRRTPDSDSLRTEPLSAGGNARELDAFLAEYATPQCSVCVIAREGVHRP
jgi:hypothetical protein